MLVLKARFKSKKGFLEAYDDSHPQGAIFCPTTRTLEEGEAVAVEIYFPDLPNKMLLRGLVLAWRSALPRLRVRAGAMVAFEADEAEKREFILAIAAGERRDAIKRRHPRLPVEVPVHWRLVNSAELLHAVVRDISIGGAQLITEESLAVDDEVVMELMAPGGAQPFSIAGRITNMTEGGYGLRFIYREGGGSRRLREVVRRLSAS
ncbi:MAG: PilZ domain-containing protein [Deltaproteobacteria bacterium]|nr:PilZ domain-containing protein [Deltaproteobacteria bacterium]